MVHTQKDISKLNYLFKGTGPGYNHKKIGDFISAS